MPLVQASLLLLLGIAASERRSVQRSDLELLNAADEGGGAATHGAAEERSADGLLADQVREGSLFLGRFRMKQVLWARSLGSDGMDKFVPFPGNMTLHFTHRKEINAGSFGETWSAYDEETHRKVAVKLYYAEKFGRRFHLTWASASIDRTMKDNLLGAAEECLTAKRIQLGAKEDPEGASRIMQCYEDHVACKACLKGEAFGMSTSGHKVTRDQPLYSVLEDCAGDGGMELDDWMNEAIRSSKSGEEYLDRVLVLFKQMFQGLAFLTAPDRGVKWVHHDLKSPNVMVKRVRGAEYVKIIDFGSVSEATVAKARGPSLAVTLPFAPPEMTSKKLQFYRTRPWSWDMYSAGCMLFHAITGHLPVEQLLTQVTTKAKQEYLRINKDFRALFALKDKVEPLLTKDWGTDKEATEKGWTLITEKVDRKYEKVMKIVAEEPQLKGLKELLMAMLSSVPSQRPTPHYVLMSPCLKERATAIDPGFDANAAYEQAAKAESARGPVAEEDAEKVAKEAAMEADMEAKLKAAKAPRSGVSAICDCLAFLPFC